MEQRKDGALLRGHGVALAWDSDDELARLLAIEKEIVDEGDYFEWQPYDPATGKGGVTIARYAGLPSLHDMAVDRLRKEGAAGPKRLGEGFNLLTTVGAGDFWKGLTGGTLTTFSNANAFLGVGDSGTAATAGQTDLQAATNKLRVAMDATYPVLATNQAQFRMTTGAAQFSWAEWGVFNANAAGDMLNRAVPSGTLGNKTGVTINWQLLVTLSLS